MGSPETDIIYLLHSPPPPFISCGPAHLLLHLLDFFDTGAPDGLLVCLYAGQGIGGARCLAVILSTSHLLLLLLLCLLELGLGIDAVSVVHVVCLHHLETRVEICRQTWMRVSLFTHFWLGLKSGPLPVSK